MSETINLAGESIEKLRKQYVNDDHFSHIVLPRLRFISELKKLYVDLDDLEWIILYSPVNKANNAVRIQLKDPRGKFAFYYNIPLLQRFQLQLFLGNNTFNFFEAHPFLIEKEIIKEDEYEVKATINTLPHLILTSKQVYYELAMIDSNQEKTGISDSKINQSINSAFNQFNEPLFNIINAKWLL